MTAWLCTVCGERFNPQDQLLYCKEIIPDRDAICYNCLQESTLRAKWMMDGAETLDIAVQLVEGHAKFLRQLIKDGWKLSQPIKDDYAFISRNPSRMK